MPKVIYDLPTEKYFFSETYSIQYKKDLYLMTFINIKRDWESS